ncbi:MAG: hypothetical protein AAF502_01090 [Bacteroidota bacterium]
MTKFKFLVFFLLFASGLYAQSGVFILVDVSGSGPSQTIRNEAKAIAQDLVKGKFDAARYSDWEWLNSEGIVADIAKGQTKPLMSAGDYCIMMPFGSKSRYTEYKLMQSNSFPGDFDNFYAANYPRSFRDLVTFREVAQAWTASVAKEIGVREYFIIEVSDVLNDFGSNPPNYSPQEERAIAEYGSSKAKAAKIGTLKATSGGSKNFQIQVRQVDIKDINPPKVKIDSTNLPGNRRILTLLKPTGSKKKPNVHDGDSYSVSWNCVGCDANTKAVVSLKDINNSKNRVKSISTAGRSARFKELKSGTYRATVKVGTVSKSGYVKINAGGGGGFFGVILLLALAAGAGYYIWNNYFRNREKTDDRPGNRPSSTTTEKPTNTDSGLGDFG